MTLIRKSIALVQTAVAAIFVGSGHQALDASELDSYLFNREARMDEALGPERAGIVVNKV